MTRRRFEVVVSLKPGLADPQGRTIEDALPTMGWDGVSDVRVGRHIQLTVDSETDEEARRVVEDVARRLLSNPVIEHFRILATHEVSA